MCIGVARYMQQNIDVVDAHCLSAVLPKWLACAVFVVNKSIALRVWAIFRCFSEKEIGVYFQPPENSITEVRTGGGLREKRCTAITLNVTSLIYCSVANKTVQLFSPSMEARLYLLVCSEGRELKPSTLYVYKLFADKVKGALVCSFLELKEARRWN